jgi:hypothetical protein
MYSKSTDVSNEQYIARFEAGAITPEAFHHADHVKLAFACLRKYPVLEALSRFSAALKRFASAQGKQSVITKLSPLLIFS